MVYTLGSPCLGYSYHLRNPQLFFSRIKQAIFISRDGFCYIFISSFVDMVVSKTLEQKKKVAIRLAWFDDAVLKSVGL